MNLHLREKVIIVTGGARGIGEGISLTLGLEEAFVVVVDNNETDIQRVVEKIGALGGMAYGIEADLGEPSASEKTVRLTSERFGRIDGLVNTLTDITQFVLAHLKKTKGTIVNIGSKVVVEMPPFEHGVRANAVVVPESFEKRMAATDEIANMVAFLLSKRSSYTTGQQIHIWQN